MGVLNELARSWSPFPTEEGSPVPLQGEGLATQPLTPAYSLSSTSPMDSSFQLSAAAALRQHQSWKLHDL